MIHQIDLRPFFLKDYTIDDIKEDADTLTINLLSTSTSAVCPKCGCRTSTSHGRYHRKNIVDLPFLDHAVILNLNTKEYICPNDGKFPENPENFLLPRKSVTQRCQAYLTDIKYQLNGNITSACKVAAHAHIPVDRGVIRYLPHRNINISESDRCWIMDILRTAKFTTINELINFIHENCERNLHPDLVDLSSYRLKTLLAEDERFKGVKKIK